MINVDARLIPPHPSPLMEAMIGALSDGFACGHVKLPVLPEVAHRILSLANDPHAGLDELSRLIRQDQGVAANVLRHANSAAYSTGQPIESIDEALMRLGMAAVSGIALTACMEGEGFKTPGYEPERRRILMHAMLSGGFARDLASRSRRNPDTSFVSGLLHTVGKPIVLRLVCDMQRGHKIHLSSHEILQLVGTFHATAAEAVALAWNLPPYVRIAAIHHKRPDEAPEPREDVILVALAGELAAWVVHGSKDDEEQIRELPHWKALQLGDEDGAELASRCLALRGMTASALI